MKNVVDLGGNRKHFFAFSDGIIYGLRSLLTCQFLMKLRDVWICTNAVCEII